MNIGLTIAEFHWKLYKKKEQQEHLF